MGKTKFFSLLVYGLARRAFFYKIFHYIYDEKFPFCNLIVLIDSCENKLLIFGLDTWMSSVIAWKLTRFCLFLGKKLRWYLSYFTPSSPVFSCFFFKANLVDFANVNNICVFFNKVLYNGLELTIVLWHQDTIAVRKIFNSSLVVWNKMQRNREILQVLLIFFIKSPLMAS